MARPLARRTTDRLTRGTGILAVLLVSCMLTLPAAAVADDDAAARAAGWLADQLVDGERLEVSFEDEAGDVQVFADHGGTADVVFALAATGVAPETASAAVDWLAAESDLYTGRAFGTASAGATAKLILTLLADGRDPRTATDTDLVALLGGLEVADGPDTGRFADDAEEDWSSTFTQSLGVLALHRAGGVEPSDDAVGFLRAQQCEDGGFRFEPGADPCTSHVDTSALAVQALDAIGEDASDTVSWLRAQQDADGGFGNANSTGLAAVALEIGGASDAAVQARGFLATLQDHCGDGPGAIGFDLACEGDPVFATRQGVLGLAGASLAAVTVGGDTSGDDASRPGAVSLAIVALVGFGVAWVVMRRVRA